jgi:hypothetical protein
MHLSEEEFQAELATSDTFEKAHELFSHTDSDTPEGERRSQVVFDKALGLVSTFAEAEILYGGSNDTDEQDELAFSKMLELSVSEDDFLSLLGWFEEAATMLQCRDKLSRIFKKADELDLSKD